MPFTLAHPAAILPFLRTPLVPSALVLGSMAPDLPYYVSLLWIGGDYNLTLTHRVSSVFWLDPLIALVLLAVFHLLLKQPLVALLPQGAAQRVWPVTQRFIWHRVDAVGWIVLSVVVGAATHLAWDKLDDVFGYSWSSKLDLVSGVVGSLVLATWIWRWWRTTRPQPVPANLLRATWQRNTVIGALLVLAILRGIFGAANRAQEVQDDLREYGTWSLTTVAQYALRQFAMDAVTTLALAGLVYAISWHLATLWQNQRTTTSQT